MEPPTAIITQIIKDEEKEKVVREHLDGDSVGRHSPRSLNRYRDFAPEEALGGTNVPDAGEQLLKVIATASLLQAFVVHGRSP